MKALYFFCFFSTIAFADLTYNVEDSVFRSGLSYDSSVSRDGVYGIKSGSKRISLFQLKTKDTPHKVISKICCHNSSVEGIYQFIVEDENNKSYALKISNERKSGLLRFETYDFSGNFLTSMEIFVKEKNLLHKKNFNISKNKKFLAVFVDNRLTVYSSVSLKPLKEYIFKDKYSINHIEISESGNSVYFDAYDNNKKNVFVLIDFKEKSKHFLTSSFSEKGISPEPIFHKNNLILLWGRNGAIEIFKNHGIPKEKIYVNKSYSPIEIYIDADDNIFFIVDKAGISAFELSDFDFLSSFSIFDYYEKDLQMEVTSTLDPSVSGAVEYDSDLNIFYLQSFRIDMFTKVKVVIN